MPAVDRARGAQLGNSSIEMLFLRFMVEHNIKPGVLKHCQICGSPNLELVLDVGHQPLCDSLLTKEQLDGPEVYYPLRLLRCPSCTLAQLDFVVDGSKVYHQNY